MLWKTTYVSGAAAEGESDIPVPSEGTVRKIMEKIGFIHKPCRKASGITKADHKAHKSDDLLKRHFNADKPLEKTITDISELKGSDGKVYVSVIFDCFDLMPLGLAIEDNMRAVLCCHALENAKISYPDIAGCIIHSDRGSQYTSAEYREKPQKYGIVQSMNSVGRRCHDNARCESIWARMKEELFYHRGRRTDDYAVQELKAMVWRYFISYWSNHRICSAIGGIPPAVKRQKFYAALSTAA